MRNDDQKYQGAVQRSGRTNGFIPTSFRAFSSYLKIVSSGASTVASTVRSAASAASAIVDRDNDTNNEQVQWAGFDKLECEGGIYRQVLLLGYRFGFQVWDVEEADNLHDLVSRHDGPVSFMQMSPNPIALKRSGDKFADSRQLLVTCADGSVSGNVKDGVATYGGSIQNCIDPENLAPSVVRFYSLRTHSYVHVIKFRSVVYSIRCSSRVVAVLQAAQIHCFDAATLDREYTILTNPIVSSCPASASIGYGPLAVGPRWMAYSGSPVATSNSGRVYPQHLTSSASFSDSTPNGSLVAHYAKESSKQLAAGIVTLGDMGYKKLSRYYSELLPDGNNSLQSGRPGWKGNRSVNVHMADADNVGMVIVRDIVSKSVVAQFRAHKSPISALCFDPSGILLVTASVQGHNINVFRLMPGRSSISDSAASYVHLYRLQRGVTNAVIQDICFSDDSQWIMISSSRGTGHLFSISPWGGPVNGQFGDDGIAGRGNGSCVTLSVVGRIRSGNNGWRSAAAAATGRTGPLSGAFASAFRECKSNDVYTDPSSLMTKHQLLVFSPSGGVVQYALRMSSGLDSSSAVSGLSGVYDSVSDADSRLVLEAIQKWNICQKQNRREREYNTDIYGENGNSDSSKVFPEGIQEVNNGFQVARGIGRKTNISHEDRYPKYISEAELQTHQARIPLWAKPQLFFLPLVIDGIKMEEENTCLQESDIERFPYRIIEPKSKDLVPVFDHLQTPPQVQQTMNPGLDSVSYGRLPHQRSGSSYTMTAAGVAVAELRDGTEKGGWNGLPPVPSEATMDSVNNNNSPKSNTPLEIVNNRESAVTEAQSISVNNNIEGQNLVNHFEGEGEGDEFD